MLPSLSVEASLKLQSRSMQAKLNAACGGTSMTSPPGGMLPAIKYCPWLAYPE